MYLIIILGGLLGAYLFSKSDKKSKKENDPWYDYNHPTYKNNTRYNNHCWHCHKKIDSYYEKKCSVCGWFICSNCGACSNYPNCEIKNK